MGLSRMANLDFLTLLRSSYNADIEWSSLTFDCALRGFLYVVVYGVRLGSAIGQRLRSTWPTAGPVLHATGRRRFAGDLATELHAWLEAQPRGCCYQGSGVSAIRGPPTATPVARAMLTAVASSAARICDQGDGMDDMENDNVAGGSGVQPFDESRSSAEVGTLVGPGELAMATGGSTVRAPLFTAVRAVRPAPSSTSNEVRVGLGAVDDGGDAHNTSVSAPSGCDGYQPGSRCPATSVVHPESLSSASEKNIGAPLDADVSTTAGVVVSVTDGQTDGQDTSMNQPALSQVQAVPLMVPVTHVAVPLSVGVDVERAERTTLETSETNVAAKLAREAPSVAADCAKGGALERHLVTPKRTVSPPVRETFVSPRPTRGLEVEATLGEPVVSKRRRLVFEVPVSDVLAELGIDPAVAKILTSEDVVDDSDLCRLSDQDMRELGLKLGVRNKLRDWQLKH